MSCGKYSPTISASYSRDQNWWKRNGGGYGNGTNPDSDADNDGYDRYGYADGGTGPDRAGQTEDDYLSCGEFDGDEYRYPLYEEISGEWSGRLLGDLNDWIAIPAIAASLGVRTDGFTCYLEYILRDARYIGGGSWSGLSIHRDDVDALKARWNNLGHVKRARDAK